MECVRNKSSSYLVHVKPRKIEHHWGLIFDFLKPCHWFFRKSCEKWNTLRFKTLFSLVCFVVSDANACLSPFSLLCPKPSPGRVTCVSLSLDCGGYFCRPKRRIWEIGLEFWEMHDLIWFNLHQTKKMWRALLGYAIGMLNLGTLYANASHGVERCYAKAEKWWTG